MGEGKNRVEMSENTVEDSKAKREKHVHNGREEEESPAESNEGN